jgi:hypothetical protein
MLQMLCAERTVHPSGVVMEYGTHLKVVMMVIPTTTMIV